MALREVVLQDMAPHAAIRAMAMTGDTDVGQDMAQPMPPAQPPDMATATPGMAMTAPAVTELTAPGVTGTLQCVTKKPTRARQTPFSGADRGYSLLRVRAERGEQRTGQSIQAMIAGRALPAGHQPVKVLPISCT